MANISLNRYQFPVDEDFNGAATALHRLQDTYNVPAIQMARAKLGKGDDGGLPLSSESIRERTIMAGDTVSTATAAGSSL